MALSKTGMKHMVGIMYWSAIYTFIQYQKGKGFDIVLGVVNGAILYLLMLVLQWLLSRFDARNA
jgi:hypothetical protein